MFELRNWFQSLLKRDQYIIRMAADLSGMRKAYFGKQEVLVEKDVHDDPFEMFHLWFDKAKQNAKPYTESNAVCLTTVSKEGKPSSRMVLLKGYDPVDGFTVFTNYNSRKGTEMQQNPNVALLFYWDYLSRQVRIEGCSHKIPADKSDLYFNQRPKMSRISARVSQQSQPIDSRETLVKLQEDEVKRWENVDIIPRPDFWGGFNIVPERFEFWQGQSDRLHDRFVFTKKAGDSKWSYQRLQP